MLELLGIDLYQLTTAAAHAAAGRLGQQLSMSCFFREMPPHRNYVVFAGLRSILEYAAGLRADPEELDGLLSDPALASIVARAPELARALRALDGFVGSIDALPEGTLAFAGPGLRPDGTPLVVAGARIRLCTPLLQVTTDMLRAKLVETPWLGRINHMSMVASKAARIVDAAAGKLVVEFGTRRTHPAAAVDAAWAAYLAGCAGTSNVAAHLRFGIPMFGTMDHFAVQATERAELSSGSSELQAFRDFVAVVPDAPTLLVDTYDTERGIRNAVRAAGGQLGGVRLDSNVSAETVRRARQLLDELGVPAARVLVSDRLDEHRVLALRDLADGFGVGEAITCSPDAAAGIGAVAKLVANGYGVRTMKLSLGSEKASLPGLLQVWRLPDRDTITLRDEAGPSGATPLLRPVWRDRQALPLPDPQASRAYVSQQIAALPPSLRQLEPAAERVLVASPGLVAAIEEWLLRARLGAD